MLAVTLPSDIEQRVNQVTSQTGCSADEFVCEAVLDYLKKKEMSAKLADEKLAEWLRSLAASEPDPSLAEAVEELRLAPEQERDWDALK